MFRLLACLSLVSYLLVGVVAFPGMRFDEPNLQDQLERRSFVKVHTANKRQSNPFLNLPTLTIPGLLAPLAVVFPGPVTVGRKVIPDAAHPFQNPPAGSQRGGCPGLNLLANYGYIQRSGITDVGELLWAMQEAMGFAPDLAGVLVALSFRGMIDLTTLKMSIGLTDSRTSGPLSGLLGGQVPGLFSPGAHNKYEIDGSSGYNDPFFTAGNVANVFNSSRWATRRALADSQFSGLFNIDWVGEERLISYQECIGTNPQCKWLAINQILFEGAKAFTFLTFPSTASNGVVDPPTATPVETFFGFSRNSDGTYTKVPERLPPSSDGNWYRRGVGLTVPEIAQAAVDSYLRHPKVFGANSGAINSFVASGSVSGDGGQLGASPTASGVGCLVLSLLIENIPVGLLSLQTQVLALVNALLAPAMASLQC